MNGEVFKSTTTWKPQNFAKKSKLNFDLLTAETTLACVNGKVFTSTTAWETENSNSYKKRAYLSPSVSTASHVL